MFVIKRLFSSISHWKSVSEPQIVHQFLTNKKGFLVDMDGVIYHAEHVLEGQLQFQFNQLKVDLI